MFKENSKKYGSKTAGFSLVEVVMAVGVIVLFLGALIGILNVGAKNMVTNKHRMQAANLAREGLEAARSARDNAVKANVPYPWPSSNGQCYLDYTSFPRSAYLVNPGADICTNGHYGFKSATVGNEGNIVDPNDDSTVYKREFWFKQVPASDSGFTTSSVSKVQVRVTWNDYGKDHTVEMFTYLTTNLK